jgi:apolipoprotein D and lipocalin family protein
VLVAAVLLAACGTDDETTGGADPTLGVMPAGETVEYVDVSRYVGLWYEIASIPMGFQASCFNTTARYERIDDASVSVHNECNWGKPDATPLAIDGKATVTDPTTNAKLQVDFGFNQAPYWIVDLGEADASKPYPWAAVSNDTRDSLWILARTETIPETRYQAIYERLDVRGFDPARMQRTVHSK